MSCRPAARPRAGRAQGPADPGLAVRLGGVDRPDRLLLRALGGLAQAPLRGGTLAAARSAGSRGRCSSVPAQVLCGLRSGSSCSASSIYAGPARHRSPRPQLRPHLPLRHRLARLPAVQRHLRRRLPAVQPLAGDRAGSSAARSARSPGSARPTSPTRSGWAAGRPRSAWSPSSGWRSSTAPAAGSRSGSRPHAPAVAALVYSRLHAGDDGALRGRGVVRDGGGLLGLLRDVLPARLLRGQRRPARAAAGRSRRRRTGRRCPARSRW